MVNVQCRLCSCETALISLFNGKSRGNRDYIRKLVDITTGIKFEKNDACKYICFPCTIQIYNFYVFRARSVENEKKIQASTVENVKVKSSKLEIPSVGDIKSPSIAELKEFLTPWLISKQKCCTTENNEDKNKSYRNNDNITSHGKLKMIENSTRYESVQNFDKETQVQPTVDDVSTQTSEIVKSYVQTQCDLIKKYQKEKKKCTTQTEADNANRSVHIQCQLIKRNQVSKKADKHCATQTEADNANRSVHIQCELIKRNQKAKKVDKEYAMQTEAANANQSILNRCDLIKKNHKIARSGNETVSENKLNCSNYLHHKNELPNSYQKTLENNREYKRIKSNKRTDTRGGKESATQTESNTARSSDALVQTDESVLIKSNQEKLEKDSRDFAIQADFKCDKCLLGQPLESHIGRHRELDDFKLGLLSVKHELQSPQSLSPVKSLNINVDGAKSEILLSPTNSCASPRSSNLLTVQRKIRNVIICQHCDKPLYSKVEYKLHKKNHMVCNFCKKRFASIRKRKMHIESDCEVQKLIKTEPVVPLVRLEDSKDIKRKYASSLGELMESKLNQAKSVKKILRLRSRSVSNIYTNSTSCTCRISILSGISVGVDKSVQTNFLFDKHLLLTPLEYFCEKLLLKRNLKNDADDFVSSKKLKLS